MPAKHDLSEVKKIIRRYLDNPELQELIFFTFPEKSYEAVMAFYSEERHQNMDPTAAMTFILESILKIEPEDFYQRTVLWDDPRWIGDCYGKIIDKAPWFVKVMIDRSEETEENCLEQISFHPPRFDMDLESGVKITTAGEVIQ